MGRLTEAKTSPIQNQIERKKKRCRNEAVQKRSSAENRNSLKMQRGGLSDHDSALNQADVFSFLLCIDRNLRLLGLYYLFTDFGRIYWSLIGLTDDQKKNQHGGKDG